jgi:hypothetical protein
MRTSFGVWSEFLIRNDAHPHRSVTDHPLSECPGLASAAEKADSASRMTVLSLTAIAFAWSWRDERSASVSLTQIL